MGVLRRFFRVAGTTLLLAVSSACGVGCSLSWYLCVAALVQWSPCSIAWPLQRRACPCASTSSATMPQRVRLQSENRRGRADGPQHGHSPHVHSHNLHHTLNLPSPCDTFIRFIRFISASWVASY